MLNLRFISPLALLIVLTLPCSGCARDTNCTFIPRSASTGPVIPEAFGVNIDFTDPRPGEMKMISDAGFRWVRMDLKWDATEKERGRYDFSDYDRLMTALEPHGIHALFILDYGNPLYDNGAPPRTEATRQAFARWAIEAAKHFAGRRAIWEVYNEPNHSTFWPPKPNPQEYVALALAVGRAFRAAVPDEKLIGPATSEIDFSFLESCFKAGLLEYWSAVSVHPYRRSEPETAAQDYCRLRELIKKYVPKLVQSPKSKVQSPANDGTGSEQDIPIISSEWGYSAVWPGVNEEKQGELLARAFLINMANGISLSIWYDWRDDGLNPNEPEHHFGTVSNFYHDDRVRANDPKPAYLAAKTLATFFSGYRFEKRIDVGVAEDYVLAFRKGNELRFAAWTTGARAGKFLIPLSAGAYSALTHKGQDVGILRGDQKGLLIDLTTAPMYLRPHN
ncbi:MAG TPA: cellulase family glycosylhydrolase [Pyrinomonadaceae bacterium]|jgi:hypothetical protein|nr:cellulase family glycosylhydrolase [Pyrinomonadaceae bacterium]